MTKEEITKKIKEIKRQITQINTIYNLGLEDSNILVNNLVDLLNIYQEQLNNLAPLTSAHFGQH